MTTEETSTPPEPAPQEVQAEPQAAANLTIHGGDITTLNSAIGGETVVITGNLTAHTCLV